MRLCTRPDCSGPGSLSESTQMCDVCFRAPLELPGPPPTQPAGTEEPTAYAEYEAEPGDPCPREHCDGILGDDNICESCFRAAPAVVRQRPGPRVSVSIGPAMTDTAPPLAGGPDPRPLGSAPIWLRPRWSSETVPADAAAGDAGAAIRIARLDAGRAERTGPRLGLGLVDIARLPARDTAEMVLSDPLGLQGDLRCTNCRADLSGQRPAPSSCPRCGRDISLRRPLEPGETLGHQYRIQGCVGRGGQGWVYLAHDLNLDNDRVAVKGLRDRAHQDMFATELLNLIAVKHPDIVAVRNYVTHRDPASDRLDGYIVMEFVDGVSLQDKVDDAGGRLPVAEALAYVLATLPALGYLHEAGLAYGDYKPQNIMQSGDRVKLVDLGAVTKIGPYSGRGVWATRGFAAPEIHHAGPDGGASPGSDIHCVGRTLALLTAPFDLVDAHGGNRPLPTPDREPVFAKYESFYRLLRRATAPAARDRFGSVGEFAEQLAGVLREVMAIGRGVRSPAPSVLFLGERDVVQSPPREVLDPAAAALSLPLPQYDRHAPEAALLESAAAASPEEVAALLEAAPQRTPDVAGRLALAHIANGDDVAARAVLASVSGGDGTGADATGAGPEIEDWRIAWYGAVLALARGNARQAGRRFAAILDAFPGEAAPKLALAACAEVGGDYELARHYYQTVWSTDDSYVSAAFGVARCRLAEAAAHPGLGSTAEATDLAIQVLEAIPDRLRYHLAARTEALRLRLDHPRLDLDGLRRVVHGLERLQLTDEQRLRLEVQLWTCARAALRGGRLRNPAGGPGELLGVRLADDEIGRALARCHLLLRRYASNRREVAACARAARLARPRTRW